jgi:glycosyltransferase involved in cell wall biosynthesis
MDYKAKLGTLRRAVTARIPLRLKVLGRQSLHKSKLESVVRSKRRFRFKRSIQAWLPSLSLKPQGVNLVAYIRAEMGLGVVARGMAAAMDAVKIPFNVINLQMGNLSRHGDFSWKHKEVRTSSYDITVVCVNPDNSFSLKTQVPLKVLGKRYVIANWFWELPELPDEWVNELEFVDEVWAASQFIKDAVSGKISAPVVRVPPVVRLDQTKFLSRAELGLPDRRFTFLAMFDTNSVLQRKNPLGVVAAFKQAFPNNDSNVSLVLKFNNPGSEEPLMQELHEQTAGLQNVVIIERIMDRSEVNSLIAATDCFVSLHRSEGFGLGPAEAMSLGKPVIVTNWSGNVDYMTPDNSVAIDFELVKLGRDYGPYKAHQHWAEPNVEQAAHWMKRLVDDPALAKQIGARGQETIQQDFSPEAVGRIINARLQEIRQHK